MIRGLYTSGWSMLANSKKMDVISNNLANANTTGYKKDTVVFQSFPEVLAQRLKDTDGNGTVGEMTLGNDVGEIYTNFTPAQLAGTGGKLDIALEDNGKGFFTIGMQQENGEIKELYSRDGAFSINSKGMLVNKDGNMVMGEGGAIYLKGENFSILADGGIIQDGAQVGKLKLVSIQNTDSLRKQGNNLLLGSEETTIEKFNGTIQQGFVEQSNVNIVQEMVDMISVSRAYEANQKVLQAQDSTLDKAVNQIGSLR